jgi:hypothetical protein
MNHLEATLEVKNLYNLSGGCWQWFPLLLHQWFWSTRIWWTSSISGGWANCHRWRSIVPTLGLCKQLEPLYQQFGVAVGLRVVKHAGGNRDLSTVNINVESRVHMAPTAALPCRRPRIKVVRSLWKLLGLFFGPGTASRWHHMSLIWYLWCTWLFPGWLLWPEGTGTQEDPHLPWMYGLVVIRLSIKVYNSADIPDGEGPAKRRMTHWAEWTMGPPP